MSEHVQLESVRQLVPLELVDETIERYKSELDLSLIRENLKLTVEQRLERHMALQRLHDEFREAGRRFRRQ